MENTFSFWLVQVLVCMCVSMCVSTCVCMEGQDWCQVAPQFLHILSRQALSLNPDSVAVASLA